MRYEKHTTGGGFDADKELMNFLNALPKHHQVVTIQAGKYGSYHGLDEEYERGYMIVVDTSPHVPHFTDDEGKII